MYDSLGVAVYDEDGKLLVDWKKENKEEGDNWIKLQNNTTYYVKIYTILWSENYTADGKITLTYEADVSDAKEEATPYTFGTKIYENVKVENDSDWYVIKTESYPAYYNIWLKNIDLYNGVYDSLTCYLYDADGAQLLKKSNASAEEMNMWIKLEPNSTYYMLVKASLWSAAYKGSYCFSVTSEADIVDEMGTTAPVVTSGVENVSTFRAEKDVDYFRFKTPKYAVACDVEIKNIDVKRMTMEIFDADGVSVHKLTATTAQNVTSKIKLKSNKIYYLKMSTSGLGNYKFKVTAKKESGDKKKQAETIKLKKNNARSIDSNDDVDWFKIKIKKTKKYKVTLKNINFTGGYYRLAKAYIYKGSKCVKEINVATGKSKSSKIKMKKGTYYIKVISDGASMGDYKLQVK